jgi:hypothetical protein
LHCLLFLLSFQGFYGMRFTTYFAGGLIFLSQNGLVSS